VDRITAQPLSSDKGVVTAWEEVQQQVAGAQKVRDDETLQRVAHAYAEKYGWHVTIRDGAFYADGAPTAGPPPYEVYEVRPQRAFSFGLQESFHATRYHFEQTT
jgi:hypothetical protein